MASSSCTHPNYFPFFIKPPSLVKELDLAELWVQMDKYIASGYQDTSSHKEPATNEKRPTAAEKEEPATEEKRLPAAEEEGMRVVEEVKSHAAKGEEEPGADNDNEEKPTADNDDEVKSAA